MPALELLEQAGSLSLIGTALLLGFRHGIDWDHIAAITDIASTTTTVDFAEEGMTSGGGAIAVARSTTFRGLELRALGLSSLYALGHASVVVVLGVLALSFAAILPDWIDPVMERVVGITLLVLGVWVFYSLVQYVRGEGEFQLKSRWMLVFAFIRHGIHWLQGKVGGHEHHGQFHVDQYGAKTAFGVGMIHGIGAETGTQVFIIAAVGGAASRGMGYAMLLAFVAGLVVSNSLVALLASTGFITSARAKPFYIAVGVFAGVFSLVVGAYFALGIGDALPDLQHFFGFLGGVQAD